MKNMPVIILSGGQGTRLKEETEFRPKPMITIGGKPMLWHIMKIYKSYGFNRFIIALGYKGEMIIDYFKKNNNDGFDIEMVDTGLETLTGERVLRVKNYINSDQFMVTYGDGVGNVDISGLISFHNKQKTIGTITGIHPLSKWGLIIRDRHNLIRSFRQKPRLNEYVNGGFMVFNKDFFDYLKEGEMIEDSFQRLIKKRQLSVFIHDGFWQAMDTYQDMEELNKLWLNDPKWKIWK